MTLACRNTQEVLHNGSKAVLRTCINNTINPPYQSARNPEEEPVIPDTTVFEQDNASLPLAHAERLPTVAECAIHLELLETLFHLRQQILQSGDIDKTMGTTPNRQTKTGYNGDTKTFKDDTLESRRQTKWPRFIEFAVVRFLDWRARLAKEGDKGDAFTLPPLDVIMVWHTFLLNPLLFNKHCRTEKLYEFPLPWQAIHKCINNGDWSFAPQAEAGADSLSLFELFSTWDSYLADQRSDVKSKLSLASIGTDLFDTTQTDSASATRTSNFPSILSSLTSSSTRTQKPQHITREDLETLPATNPVRAHVEMFLSVDVNLARELKAAVLRQNSFVDKMHSHLWIRSPSLQDTLARSLSRYSQFLLLMRRNRGKMMVPTLDIDLAWHTHQCAASGYVQETKKRVGRFVNHDDSIGKGDLDTGSGETRRLWRLQFGGEYHICGCWDCEMLTSEIEKEFKYRGGADDEDEKYQIDMQAVAERVDNKVRFYRAVEAARRKGHALPVMPRSQKPERVL
ncbi:uncharacterized protein PODANS_2_13530 [Podospora anserina S mat+]|uniref:Podospora anserina S mat+ genomic DNA chromosome 2, supercontig 3 n=1 Tax=Podospora anserina (strain S / ATCC MYA-4624 / DSM 980 / FGSC 10383) TaxID=515849 RepID=B2AC52_PODAN|nr:uncharacterized protein PODANS_2_13530 [Podospora anserina S mat+]CAP60953.1 unnamed protein product [Podospora anserina S mat+]CDP26475.1 Putative protein of unknown function [Podospora anserina S mat+]